MKKAVIISVATLFSVMLVSCPDFALKPVEPLEVGEFWAQNMSTKLYYKVKADMLHAGEKCEIWAEKGSMISRTQARTIANEYDTLIRPRIADAFSEKNLTYSYNGTEYSFDDMLDFANWLTNGNGKLTILLLDIQDGFKNLQTDPYIAGYFSSINFYDRDYSNRRDMIYVDTYPGMEMRPKESYTTFAHELQHLVNYVIRHFWLGKNTDTDLWINEGLSAFAEYLYLGVNPDDKCKDFSLDRAGTIAKGNNFFVWGNYTENPLSILDEYSSVYLFFRWLYLQAADAGLQSRIFRDITYSDHDDFRAVTDVAGKINADWYNWESLLKSWFAANHYPGNAVYGYKGDQYLQETVRIKPIAGSNISLYPGEGVYSVIIDSSPPASMGNIRYERLTGNPRVNNMLLTFNANTNGSAAREEGSLTGVPLSVSRTAAENAQTIKIDRPYVIDARDALGRD